jgi:hypothetical protein
VVGLHGELKGQVQTGSQHAGGVIGATGQGAVDDPPNVLRGYVARFLVPADNLEHVAVPCPAGVLDITARAPLAAKLEEKQPRHAGHGAPLRVLLLFPRLALVLLAGVFLRVDSLL